MSKKIKFYGPQIEFDEWLEPGFTEPNSVVRKFETPSELEEPEADYAPSHRLYYLSFGSGSSGNCSYVGSEKGGILIDAGIKPDDVELMLSSNGVGMNHVKAILLTHDHTDHVKYVYQFLRRHKHIRLFCTNRIINGLLRRHSISKRIREYHTPIFKEIPFKVIDFEVTAFEVPHDGSDNMGFHLSLGDKTFVLATDMGEISSRADHYIRKANYLVIESNYDSEMLRNGSYPEYLKSRIANSNGHMGNHQTAEFLSRIITPELRFIFLCHLSKDNNLPDKALEAVRTALEAIGKKVGNAAETLDDRMADVQLMALPRYQPTRWFVFR